MATRMNVYINKNLPTIIGREEPSLPGQDLRICKLSEDIQVGRSLIRVINKGHGHIKKKDYTGYVNTSDLAQMTVTTVPIPANFAGLEAVDVPTRLQYQYFEIYDVVEEENEVVITARHIWYQNLQNNTLWKPEANTSYSASAVCRNVMNEAMFETDFDVASDCTDTLPSEELDFERKNLVEAFLDPENGICKKFGLSLIRDNYKFYCLKNVGYDRGFVVQYGKNLLGVEREESIENVATRIAPFGKNAKGEIVWLDNNGLKYIDSQYVGDYSSPRLEMLDTGLQIGKDGVTADNIQAKLLEMAQKRFSEDEVDKPEVTMEIEFISLGDTEEYQQYRDLDKVYLYDIITIKDEEKGYNYSAQVIGIEHDVLTGMLKSVTIGSLKQADASRKIAVWQVPEIDGANIRLLSIQAGSFVPEAIQNTDLAPLIITADKIVSGEIDTRHLKAGSVKADQIDAGAVIAEKIHVGAVTAEKIDVGAVTAEKINSGEIKTRHLDTNSVTAEKIKAGEINSNHISTTDIDAINAKLGIASIANAQIESADINFAHIKDLNAQSAFFEQTIFDEAVGGKLYVPRLAVGYAQMVGATIGDLVIQASNGKYYGIDVDMSGNVTATERTVTQGEIASGHTADGRTLVLGTDILATDLNTENIYASHALMNEITANIINVDQLFAREATIGKINALDLSSNTYIRSTIGDWDSGSTITQTVNTLVSRIGELGYGTVYFQPDEPNHSDLSAGDIWVQSISTGSWNTVKTDYSSWTEIKNTIGTWQTVGGIPKMFIWDGRFWQEMYDAYLPTSMQTEIEQLASAINLRATKEEVNVLSGEVTEFSAQLSIQAQEISSAVSAVNLKAASYVMNADPRTVYTVSVGDIWVKRDEFLQSWASIKDNYSTWTEFKNNHLAWKDGLGEETYVWNGEKWILTSDRASEIYQKTLIDQTINQVSILAEASAQINEDVIRTKAQLTVTNSSIQAEVERATTAEGGKLDKTTQYQTADAIVSEAVSQSATAAGETYLAKTTQYQTADAIVTEAVRQSGTNANSNFIKKTTTYQDATSIVTAAVSQAGTNANANFIKKSGKYTSIDAILAEAQSKADAAATTAKNASIAKTQTYQSASAIVNAAVAQASSEAGNTYLAKTETYQTADSIVSAAESYVDGELENYSTTTQTSTMISQYVGNNAYGKVSGITITSAGVDVSGSQYVKIASGGAFRVTSGNFGIKSDAGANDYVIWSGADTAANSSFRVTKGGVVTLTKLKYLNANGTETEFNPRTGLWKLDYHTVKAYSTDSITLSNGAVINFIKASSLSVGGEAGRVFVLNAGTEVSGTARTVVVGIDTESEKTYSGGKINFKAKAFFSATGVSSTIVSSPCVIEDKDGSGLAYDAGKNSVSVTRVTLGAKITGTQYNCSVVLSNGTKASTINCATPYSDGQKAVTANTGDWSAGKRTITLSSPNTNTYEIQIPNGTGWKLENTADKTAKATVTVGEKEITHTFTYDWINHGDYDEGKADGIEEYYNSSYWSPATAENNWTPQIPNSTNTGSVGWTTSGASDAFEAGKNGVSVQRVTLGTLITGTQYNCSVLLSNGLTRAGTINCATAYSDARAGYTAGIFNQYSGAQLYTMGQSGPEKYTGTLYVKS